MCTLQKFIINFEELRENEETFSFKLDADYFKAINADEIQGGEIETTVKVSRASGCFEVVFCSKGYVVVECSRCLDPIKLSVDTKDKLFVKVAAERIDEGDELITIPETDQTLDLSWHIYEFIALAIPAQHVHEEGQCNEEMLKIWESTSEEDEEQEDTIDPRWAKLMEIKNNK